MKYSPLSASNVSASPPAHALVASPSRCASRARYVALRTFVVFALALAIFGFRCLTIVDNSPCVDTRPRPANASSTLPVATPAPRRRRLPDAIIMGVRKCGTRALLTFLGTHPSIKQAGKEIHFFDENYDNGVEWYLRQMPNAAADQVVIEKTPAYFTDADAPERVLTVLGTGVKLILIVKDPVERAVSDYLQLKIKFQKKTTDYDATMAPFERKVLTPDGRRVNPNYKPIRIGDYARHLSRWLGYFPRQRILVLDGEEFVRDPFPSLVRVETFLGIDHELARERFFFNPAKGFYCLRREGVRDRGLNDEGCLNKSKGRPHPPISDKTREELTRFYSPKLEAFFRLIGSRFDDWPTALWNHPPLDFGQ